MKYLLFSLALVLTLGPVSTAWAHELLPREIVQFIKDNPDASAEELRAFAIAQDPEVSEKFLDSSAEEIVTIIQDDTSSGFFHNGWDFVKFGIEHILAGPDHILFILSLLLVFISISHTIKLATVFTIAHSITIALAATNVLVLSAAIVEPLIALSIAVMAIATVFLSHLQIIANEWGKFALVFFFGLFHGLGFAGLLQQIAIPDDRFLSSLLFFNLGIEFGQLFVIVLALPAILYFRASLWYPRAVRASAVLISIVAFFWFIERVFPHLTFYNS